MLSDSKSFLGNACSVRKHAQNGNVGIALISGKANLADMFAKAAPAPTFKKSQQGLGESTAALFIAKAARRRKGAVSLHNTT